MAFEPMKLRHEPAGVHSGRVLFFALAFLAFSTVLIVLLAWFYRTEVVAGRVKATFEPFPAPRLQDHPTQDFMDFRKAQNEQLGSYRWVDDKARIIHVPIDRAMDFVAARGTLDPIDPSLPSPNGQRP